MQGLKSAILAIFQTGPGWLCPVSTALKNPSVDFKNIFALGFYEFVAKLERAYSFRVQSGKMTVCSARLVYYLQSFIFSQKFGYFLD